MSVRGISTAPTLPICGSANQGMAYTSASSPITQSASIRMIMSALVILIPRFSAAAWPPLGAFRTSP